MLSRIHVNPADIQAVKSIPQEYSQETPLKRNEAIALIHKMEKMGAIPRKAFRVRTFREGDKKKVAIYHKGHTEQPSRSKHVSSKVPTPETTASFIQAQPDFRHDLKLISEKFLEQEVSSHENGGLYYAMRNIAIQARQLIEKEQGGRFVEEKAGHRKFYRWTK